MEYQLVSVREDVEYGLRTPSGNVIWPPDTYRGFDFSDEAQRADMPNVLRVAGSELGFDPEEFAGSFKWVPRSVTTMIVAKVSDGDIGIDDLQVRDAELSPSTPNE